MYKKKELLITFKERKLLLCEIYNKGKELLNKRKEKIQQG